MTTDNRTNEQAPEQVEAAAKAMWDLRKLSDDPEWDALEYGVKQEYRKDARAALVAAQGAAPQAGSEPIERFDLEWAQDYAMSYWQFGGEPKTQRALTLLNNARVLPSSTVDEDALAEVISADPGLYVVFRYEALRKTIAPRIARAIIASQAEWLKGQGG